jgi:small-conductance mechanosensitive channel
MMWLYSHLQTTHYQYADNVLLLFFMLVLMDIVGMEPTKVLSGPRTTAVFIGSWVGSQRSPLISKHMSVQLQPVI